MTPICKWFILFCLLLLEVQSHAQEKYSRIKVHFPEGNISMRNDLIGLLEIDHFTPRNGNFVAEVNAKLLRRLDSLHVPYDVLVDDMAERLEQRNRDYYARIQSGADANRVPLEQQGSAIQSIIRTPSSFEVKSTFGGYYSFAEMNTAMNNLVSGYPGIAQKISLGITEGGRNIWCLKISDNVSTDELNEPEILYMGLQHAREAITGASMIFFMQYLCENYGSDNRIKDLVDNREIFIIPCFNPDGWEYNRTTATGTVNKPGGGWRKNRSNTSGGIGVDLNRNWGVDWSDCDSPIQGNPSSCGSGSKAAETFWGNSVFSEDETQAVRSFVKAHHFVAGFDQHAYGPYYSLPFGRQSLHPGEMSTKGQNFYTAIPALMGTYNGMRAGDSYDALHYEVAGGFKDWMLMGEIGSTSGSGIKDTVWAMTGEGAAGGGSSDPDIINDGYEDFWPDAGQIVRLSKGMCYQNIQLAFAAGTYADIQDGGNISLGSLTGTMNFRLKRLGLGNEPVTVSLIPIENMQAAGVPVTISSMSYYADLTGGVSYILPPTLANGQRVKFAWKVQAGGYTYSDTVIKFLNPVEIVDDDMEGSFATNWINTATSVASGFGYNYTPGSWVFTGGGQGGGRSLSESAAGTNYGSAAIRSCEYANDIDLSNATAAYLNFWTKHYAENFRDKLQVQVNAGAGWVAISGTTTVQEPGSLDNATINGKPALTGIRDYWTQETYDLSAYKGNAALHLRFVFTSDNDPSSFAFERADGFYIDDLKIIKSTVTLSTLPVTFLNFTGLLQPDGTVRLQWEAITDEEHDHFEVEKSSNGAVFTSIGRGTGTAPYFKLDPAPFTGNNFYRIRQQDKNGKVSYSTTINVEYRIPGFSLKIFPNPVTDQLKIKLSTVTAETFSLSLTDLSGRVIKRLTIPQTPGEHETTMDLRGQGANLYFLTIRNSRNEIVATQKITKQ